MTITLLAIDGAGKQTEEYLKLLLDSAEIFPVKELLLLTSDTGAKHETVRCCHVPVLDYLGYSKFCIEQLSNFINTDFVLNLQFDGFILNPKLWNDEFLNYDYIGAPWQNKKTRPLPQDIIVGNGGFSLRSKKLLNKLTKIKWYSNWENCGLPKEHWGNEDYFICVINRNTLESSGIKFAPIELAKQFSVQSGDHLGRFNILKNVFGFHGTGLMGKARLLVEKNNIYYEHLSNVKKSVFPLRY